MNFNEIGLKDLVLDFDSNDLQDITIVQGDTKTRGFKVLVSTNNGEIIKASSQYEMRLYGINSNYPDKSFFTKGVIDGDFYKVYISTDMASKSGKLQLQLALFEGKNALIQSRIKEVDVYRSIANGGNVGKDLVVDFGKLKEALETAEKQQKKFEESLVRQESVESKINQKHTEVVQIRNGLKDVLTTENARVEAEKKRVSAENTRVSQESTRQSNETTRQSNENARQQKESTRQSNETQRQAEESTRKSEEQKRITAETNRDSAETKRDNAEKIRIENENKRISAENKRAENDTKYSKNETSRQSQESVRQKQEQQRVEAEKLRQSQEDTRKQSEDTRNSQEKTRQSNEESRKDEETKRVNAETSRKQSEQTRSTKETERQKAEQTRQSNENTRQQQETDRVEAEKQRAAAESDRAGKFAGWDKTMQGFIPTATSTVAGIVRIDTDGETVAASKKTVDDVTKEFTKTCNSLDSEVKSCMGLMDITRDVINNNMSSISKMSIEIENKADKVDLEKKSNLSHKHTIEDISDLKNKLDEKASNSDLRKTNNAVAENSQFIMSFPKELENKADKKHTHEISSITNLQTTLDNKATKTDISSLKNSVSAKADKKHTHEIEDVNNLQVALNLKASESHTHDISDINNLQYTLNNKASASDLSSLKAKVNNISTDRVTLSSGGYLKFWTGTQSQYDNIYYKDSNTIYFITE